jgi:hypothetical protein
MAERIRANRNEFLSTYENRKTIQQMNAWVISHPNATLQQTTSEFERLIRAARLGGATVSNHLSDHARDISWPNGTPQQLNNIENRINALGGLAIRELNAAGGPHWHIDWN